MALQNFNMEYSKVCRTCLDSNVNNMKSIFTVEAVMEEQISLSEVLMSVTTLQINKGDGFPEQICLNCSQEMNRAFLFKKLCENSNRTLTGYLQEVKPDLDDVEQNLYYNGSEGTEVVKMDGYRADVVFAGGSNVGSDLKWQYCDDISEGNNTVLSGETNEEKAQKKEIAFHSVTYSQIKIEEEEMEFKSEDLHHSVIIKEESVLESQPNIECTLEPNGKRFSCKLCDYKSAYKGDLKKHLITHSDEKPFGCELCDYKCARQDRLKLHLRTHTDEKPFPCTLCDYKFARKSYLNKHLRTHTGEKPFKCELCDYKCAQKANFQIHLRNHTGEKTFMCDICDFSSTRKESLKGHLRTHTGEKPFTCEICGSKFGQRGNLNIHLRTHTGEKSFKCDFCDFSSVRKESVIIHLRTHTGEKPFSCTICDFKTAHKGDLRNHQITHTAEKTFNCELCDYQGTRKLYLEKHLISHRGEKPYSCEICGYKFAQKRYLKSHYKTHTGKTGEYEKFKPIDEKIKIIDV